MHYVSIACNKSGEPTEGDDCIKSEYRIDPRPPGLREIATDTGIEETQFRCVDRSVIQRGVCLHPAGTCH